MSIHPLRSDELLGGAPPRWSRIVIVRIVVLIILSGLALVMLEAGITWAVVGAVLVLATTEARKMVHVPGLT